MLAAPAAHSQTERSFSARLEGANEVPPINSAGTADFRMSMQQGTINFSLNFAGLTSPLVVAHLHFAPSKVAGGVMIFLCGGGGQPACPAATSGSITGTITAANVTGRARASLQVTSIPLWMPCATVCPTRTCTPRIFPAVRFAVRFVGAPGTIKATIDPRNRMKWLAHFSRFHAKA